MTRNRRLPGKITEADVKDQIRGVLKRIPGLWYYNAWQGPMSKKGIPDIMGCYRGRLFGIEVKGPGGTVSKEQAERIAEIRDAGGIAIVARSAEEVVEALGLQVDLWPLGYRKGITDHAPE